MECFAPRYLVHNGRPAVHLKKLEHAFTAQELSQVFFLYTCRANLILADFVGQVYWDRYAAGHEAISNKDANAFVAQAVRDGKTQKLWSENMIDRVSSYLTGCCADYGLLEKGQKSERKILPFRLESRVAAYLAYDLHVRDWATTASWAMKTGRSSGSTGMACATNLSGYPCRAM